MAYAVSNICGFELQSQDEYDTTSGTHIYSQLISKNGLGSSLGMFANGSQTNWIMIPHGTQNTQADTTRLVEHFDVYSAESFGVNFSGYIWEKVTNTTGNHRHIRMSYDSFNQLLVIWDANGVAYYASWIPAAETWYHVSIYWEKANAGRAVVKIDGQTILDTNGDFLHTGSGDVYATKLYGGAEAATYFDNLVIYGSVSTENDRIPFEPDIFVYTTGDTTTGTPDALATGTWDDTSAVPASNASPVTLASGDDSMGQTDYPSDAGPGPYEDIRTIGKRIYQVSKISGRFSQLEADSSRLNILLGSNNTPNRFSYNLGLTSTGVLQHRHFVSTSVVADQYYLLGMSNGALSPTQVLTCTALAIQVMTWPDDATWAQNGVI
jgi:hypothetical protein